MGGALDLAAELGGIPTQKREGFVHERDYENWQFPLNAQHIAAPAPDPIDSLPERARSKLRALEFQYREASGASSAISDDIRYHRDLAREHRDKSSEAAYQAKEDRAYLPRAQAAERAAIAAEAQLREAQKREAAANERRDTAGALLSSVKDFVSNLHGLTVTEIETQTPKIPADIPAAIEAKTRRLRELQADRRRAELAPLTSKEAKALMRKQLAALAAAPDLIPLVDGRGGALSRSRRRFFGALARMP